MSPIGPSSATAYPSTASRVCRGVTPFEQDKAAYGAAAASVLGGARAIVDAADSVTSTVSDTWSSLTSPLGIKTGSVSRAVSNGIDHASGAALAAYQNVAALANTTADAASTASEAVVDGVSAAIDAVDHVVDNVAGAAVIALAV